MVLISGSAMTSFLGSFIRMSPMARLTASAVGPATLRTRAREWSCRLPETPEVVCAAQRQSQPPSTRNEQHALGSRHEPQDAAIKTHLYVPRKITCPPLSSTARLSSGLSGLWSSDTRMYLPCRDRIPRESPAPRTLRQALDGPTANTSTQLRRDVWARPQLTCPAHVKSIIPQQRDQRRRAVLEVLLPRQIQEPARHPERQNQHRGRQLASLQTPPSCSGVCASALEPGQPPDCWSNPRNKRPSRRPHHPHHPHHPLSQLPDVQTPLHAASAHLLFTANCRLSTPRAVPTTAPVPSSPLCARPTRPWPI